MKSKLLLGLALFLAALFITSISCVSTNVYIRTEEHPTDYFDSIGVVSSITSEGTVGGILATTWVLDKDRFVTAGHFCRAIEKYNREGKAAKAVSIGFAKEDGSPSSSGTIAVIEKWSMTPDVCVLLSPDHGRTPLVVAPSLRKIKSGDRVTVIGAPQGFFPFTRWGSVVSVSVDRSPDLSYLFLSCLLEPGNSGSPVLHDGKVIGMVVSTPYIPKQAAFAIKSPDILSFLKRPHDAS